MPMKKTKPKTTMRISRPLYAFLLPAAIIFSGFILYPTVLDYIHSQNAVYGEWSQWSKCLKSCGDSYQGRIRKCVKPAKGFGKTCDSSGPNHETMKCNLRSCPIDGGVGHWGPWSTKCDIDCKDGRIKRQRKCDNPKPQHYGRLCTQPLGEFKKCPSTKECPVDGKLGAWGPFAPCTKTCGGGTMTKTRPCTPAKFGGKPCKAFGTAVDVQNCNVKPCPKPITTSKPTIKSKPTTISKPTTKLIPTTKSIPTIKSKPAIKSKPTIKSKPATKSKLKITSKPAAKGKPK